MKPFTVTPEMYQARKQAVFDYEATCDSIWNDMMFAFSLRFNLDDDQVERLFEIPETHWDLAGVE